MPACTRNSDQRDLRVCRTACACSTREVAVRGKQMSKPLSASERRLTGVKGCPGFGKGGTRNIVMSVSATSAMSSTKERQA